MAKALGETWMPDGGRLTFDETLTLRLGTRRSWWVLANALLRTATAGTPTASLELDYAYNLFNTLVFSQP